MRAKMVTDKDKELTLTSYESLFFRFHNPVSKRKITLFELKNSHLNLWTFERARRTVQLRIYPYG
jgi:hypothetical protein